MDAIVAAAMARRERDIIEAFRRAGAISQEKAVTPAALCIDEGMVFSRLRRRAVIRDGAPGLLYLDEPSWTALRGIRRRLALIAIGIMVLLGLLWMLTVARLTS